MQNWDIPTHIVGLIFGLATLLIVGILLIIGNAVPDALYGLLTLCVGAAVGGAKPNSA